MDSRPLFLLKTFAKQQMADYKQYDGHEQKYVLGQIIAKKPVKTKGGVVAEPGEFILVEPIVRHFVDLNNKKRVMVTVWSFKRKVAVSINAKDVKFV